MTDEQAARLLLLLGVYSVSYEHEPYMTVRELADDLAATLPDGDIGKGRDKYAVLQEEVDVAIGQCRIWR